MQWKLWKFKKKTKEKFKDMMKELVNTEAKDLWSSLRLGFWRLVKNFVERKTKEGSKETHGGGMRKYKKQ